MGGTWYPMAAGLAELFNKNIPGLTVTVEGTGGGSTNPKWMAQKKVQLAFQVLDMLQRAKDGVRPYKKKYDLSDARSVIRMNASPAHWVVLKKSPIYGLKDLKGKRLSIGERGASSNTRVLWFLEAAGLTKDDVKLEYIGDDQATGALKDGRIDCMAETLGVPAGVILNLSTTTKVRFLELTDGEAQYLTKKWPYLAPIVIKAGTYGQPNDFVGYGVASCYMTIKEVPEDVVYQMCKVIDQNWDFLYKVHKVFRLWKFDKNIEQISGQPLHPGAMRFYKEKGIIK